MSEKLWQAFKKASDRSILFIIRNNPAKRIQQKSLIFLSFLVYMIGSTFLLINVIKREAGIVLAVVNTVFFLMTMVIIDIISELINKKENIIEVISWLTEPTWKKFHNSMQPEAGNRFNRIRNISTRIVLFQIRFYDFLSSFTTFGIGTLMQFIPSLRYELPLPWHLPIENYRQLGPFLIAFVIQIVVTISMSQVIAFCASFIIVFYLHVKEYLDIILQGFDQLNNRLENVQEKNDVNVEESLKVLVKMIASCLRYLLTNSFLFLKTCQQNLIFQSHVNIH